MYRGNRESPTKHHIIIPSMCNREHHTVYHMNYGSEPYAMVLPRIQ